MDRVGVKNKWAITNYAVFAREYLKRKVLWDKNASFLDKTDALESLAEAFKINMGARPMYAFCAKFRRFYEKKVRTYLELCLDKKLPPELALRRYGVCSWVREVDNELKFLDTLIKDFRKTGHLQPLPDRHYVWVAFVNKMVERCRALHRSPTSEDVAAVVESFGWRTVNCEVFERLWKVNQSSCLYKFRRLSQTGDKPSDTLALTAAEWGVIDIMALYEDLKLVCDLSFKSPPKTRQFVKLSHLVRIYNIEGDDGVDPKHKWAKLVWNYSRDYETSPSGAILQLRWHSLCERARSHVMSRLNNSRRKVHPLLVEIATKYPHILQDDTPWLEKVTSGRVYDVSKVTVQYKKLTNQEGVEKQKKKTVQEKKKTVQEKKKTVQENTDLPIYCLREEPGSLVELKKTAISKANKAFTDDDNVNNTVDDVQNDDIIVVSEDSSSQLSCIDSENVRESCEKNILNPAIDKVMSLDNLDKELEALEKDLNLQFTALKNLNTSDNNDVTDLDKYIEKDKEISKINTILTDENTTKQNPNDKHEVTIEKLPSTSKSKLNTAAYKKKKSVKNSHVDKRKEVNTDHHKHEVPANSETVSLNFFSYTCKASDGSNLGQVIVPAPIAKDSVTLQFKPYDELKNTNSMNASDKTIQSDVPEDSMLFKHLAEPNKVKSNVCNDVPTTSKESDLELLKKIDPTQAETVIIFSDSDNDDDVTIEKQDFTKANKIDQANKVYKLNDVKKYLNHYSIDDILMKMDDIQVKQESKKNDQNMVTFTTICLSDSDEKSGDDRCIAVSNSSTDDEDATPMKKIDITPETVGTISNTNTIPSSSNTQHKETTSEIRKETTDITKVVTVDDIPMMKVAQQLNNPNLQSEIRPGNTQRRRRFGPKANRILPNYEENAPDGLSLFKLQDKKTKETLGVLVNVKKAMKVTEFDVGVCKKVDSYLNDTDDKNENTTAKDCTENKEENSNDLHRNSTENKEENSNYLHRNSTENKEENSNDLHRNQETEKAKDNDVFWKNLLEKSNTEPLLTDNKGGEKVDDNKSENDVNLIDLKLVMDTRVYLPKLDEIDGYVINRRADYSINVTRLPKYALPILNYKRKSDDPNLTADFLNLEVKEASKRKVDDEDTPDKRIKLNVNDNVITYSRKNKKATENTDDSAVKSVDENLITNSKLTNVSQNASDTNKSLKEHDIMVLKTGLILSLPENIRNEIDLYNLERSSKNVSNSKNIAQRIQFEDEDSQSYNNDDKMYTDNNTSILDSNDARKEVNIDQKDLSENYIETANNVASSENSNKYINSEFDKDWDNNTTETNSDLLPISVKIERMGEDDTISDDELLTIKRSKPISDLEESNENSLQDTDMNVEMQGDVGEADQFSDDGDDEEPVNNIAEMLKLCKPVKLCLEKVKVPDGTSEQSQVRKVELPDRTFLNKHRAPTAHVAPINVTIPSERDIQGSTVKDDIGTLLHQLSKETASEWQRLEESIINPELIRKRHADKRVRLKQMKMRRENKKRENTRNPDADELRRQNAEWERQKSMNNRYFDLTPLYTKPGDVSKSAKHKSGKIPKETNDKIGSVGVEETFSGEEAMEINCDKIGPSETDLAVESLMNENDSNKNENVQNASCIVVNDNINFIETDKQSKKEKADSGLRWLSDLQQSVKDLKTNNLIPIFTTVENKKNTLVPIAVHRNVSHLEHEKTDEFISIPSTSKDEARNNREPYKSQAQRAAEIVKKRKSFDKNARKHFEDMYTRIKLKKNRRNCSSIEPKETIILADSDEDETTQSNSNVAGKTTEVKNTATIPSKNNETITNPPVKVVELESTLRIEGSKNDVKMMEISPMKGTVVENIFKKRLSTPYDMVIDSVVSVQEDEDLDDSSDKNKPQNKNRRDLKPKYVKKLIQYSQVNATNTQMADISVPHSRSLLKSSLMPKIVSVTSVPDDDVAKNNPKSDIKPINSDDEYDSDSNELLIDETVTFSYEDLIENELDIAKDNNEESNISDENILDENNMIIENVDTVTEIVEDIETNTHVTNESTPPEIALIGNTTQIDSSLENEPNSASKVDTVLPDTNDEKILDNNTSVVQNSELRSSDNSTDHFTDSIKISTEEPKINENVDDNLETVANAAENVEILGVEFEFQNMEINNENAAILAVAFESQNVESKKENAEILEVEFEPQNIEINKENAEIPKESSESQNNTTEVEDNNDKAVDKNYTTVNKNDTTNDDKTKVDKPRPFLKLVPIQKLLDDKKADDKATKPIVEENTNSIEKGTGKKKIIVEISFESDEELDVIATEKNKLRGEPIPFLCRTNTSDNEVAYNVTTLPTYDATTLPVISNVVSLSSKSDEIKKTDETSLKKVIKNLNKIKPDKPKESVKLDNSTPSTSNEKLDCSWLSSRTPLSVRDLIRDRDCTDLSLLCIERNQPLWQVFSDYLITTNVKLYFTQPSYWSMDGKDHRCRVLLDEDAQGSTVVGSLSIPDELCLDHHLYKNMSKEPLIYAKIVYVVPNPITCQELINQNKKMYLYNNLTGDTVPLLVQSSPNSKKKTLIPLIVNYVNKANINRPGVGVGDVIALDSDDE